MIAWLVQTGVKGPGVPAQEPVSPHSPSQGHCGGFARRVGLVFPHCLEHAVKASCLHISPHGWAGLAKSGWENNDKMVIKISEKCYYFPKYSQPFNAIKQFSFAAYLKSLHTSLGQNVFHKNSLGTTTLKYSSTNCPEWFEFILLLLLLLFW